MTTSAQKILIVEDEPDVVDMLVRQLKKATNFRTIVATDGEAAIQLARDESPALIVLDLMLPKMGGLEVCRVLKSDNATRHIPVMMLTAKGEEVDRIVGLEFGADDYVTKPFSPRELVARVRAVLRRTESRDRDADLFTIADLVIDVSRMIVTRDGEALDLTPTEFQIVATLARHAGRVFTRTQLLDAGRGANTEAFDRAVDSHIKNIRRKLERDPRAPQYIRTVYGIGYRFADA
jgi:two-component system alkaline phosphatase synthesis response regulator PhoP